MTDNRGAFMTSQRGTFRTGYETSTHLRHNTFYHGGGLCLSSRCASPQPLVHYALPTRLTAMTQRPATVSQIPGFAPTYRTRGCHFVPPFQTSGGRRNHVKAEKCAIPSDGRRAFLHIHGALPLYVSWNIYAAAMTHRRASSALISLRGINMMRPSLSFSISAPVA